MTAPDLISKISSSVNPLPVQYVCPLRPGEFSHSSVWPFVKESFLRILRLWCPFIAATLEMVAGATLTSRAYPCHGRCRLALRTLSTRFLPLTLDSDGLQDISALLTVSLRSKRRKMEEVGAKKNSRSEALLL